MIVNKFNMNEIIGGIEGGATHSHIVLIDKSGKVLVTKSAEGTNHYLIGMDEVRLKISQLVNEAKKEINIPERTPLLALGLSLSGCESEESNKTLVEGLKKQFPNLSKNYVIGSDTDGSVAATSNKGGVVCIAGTGSNTLLINPDGTRAQCGGWGYLLGDEGSAWYISFTAIKTCFADLDNMKKPPHSTKNLWKAVKDFFKIQTQPEILDSFYGGFNKAKIASFCRNVADLANSGDELSKHIFREAGECLARSISAVYSRASKELTEKPDGLQVSCVGSVWLSWNLLEPGFVSYLENHTNIKKLSLIRITSAHGHGAAFMACDEFNINVPRNYEDHYKILYNYKRHSTNCSCK